MKTDIRKARLCATVLALVCLLAPAAEARTSVARKKQIAQQRFEDAEKMREALNGKPEEQRTRGEYNRVINTYRLVYLKGPTSPRAHESLNLVGDLLVDMGRAFKDPKYFRQAIETYQFLRKEYPGSRYRWEALFTTAQLYAEELNEPENAKATFEEFLKLYPTHRLAEDAKAALEELAKPKEKKVVAKAEPPKPAAKPEAPADTPKAPAKGALPLVSAIRHWSTPDSTRVAIDLEAEVKYEAGRISDPERIFFDLHDTKLASELKGKAFDVTENGFLKKIRVAQYLPGRTRVVLEVDKVADYSAFLLPNPYRLIIDIRGAQPAESAAKTEAPKGESKPVETASAEKPAERDKSNEAAKAQDVSKLEEPVVKATAEPTSKPTVASVQPREAKPEAAKPAGKKGKKKAAEPEVRAAKPASNGETSLIRALGLKIGKIVIDAGHGGHDTGTIGPNGFSEAELVLDVAVRLGKLLENRLGAEVVYTREDDTFVPLETRTGIANKAQADLFLSIHANSSDDPKARGVETYYLNFTTSADALEVAARENAVSEKSIYELQDLVKKITLTEKVEESREFAASLQKELHKALARSSRAIRNRGVKKAPFIVLIGANMPSVLAEISFLSNPADAASLKKPAYRQRIAESLYKGIAQYANGLSGVKIASGEPAKAGQ